MNEANEACPGPFWAEPSGLGALQPPSPNKEGKESTPNIEEVELNRPFQAMPGGLRIDAHLK